MRRSLLTALAMAILLVTAGCSVPGGGSGTTNVYVSDQPNAIDDFRHLNVTITEVGVHDDDTGEWRTRNVSTRVDLTRLNGTNATLVSALDLPVGSYTKVYFEVKDVEGVLRNGNAARVQLPSNRFQVTTPFTVEANETKSYVFDIMVVPNSDGGYVIVPNTAASGPDQPIDRV